MNKTFPVNPMNQAAIALGSNLGDRKANFGEAISRLAAVGIVQAVSLFYDTEPVGYRDQPRFLNAALLLETSLAPVPLLQALLAIEQAMGRERRGVVANGPRLIDLDLLLYDDLILQAPELTLPHPRMHDRRFVLQPLADIAPGLRHPITGRTVAEMLTSLS